MCAYFSKAGDAASEAMKEAGKDGFSRGAPDYKKMKAIAKAYITKKKFSVQGAVYLNMPELWFRKTFPKVMSLNSNLPECPYRIFRKKEELDEILNDSTDIFQSNMLDRYTDRPDSRFQNGKYAILEKFCFA